MDSHKAMHLYGNSVPDGHYEIYVKGATFPPSSIGTVSPKKGKFDIAVPAQSYSDIERITLVTYRDVHRFASP